MSWTEIAPNDACLVFDTETNGLFKNGKEPRMVQLAWTICSPEKESTLRRNYIVLATDFDPNPRGKLAHGISKKRALLEGTAISEVFQTLLQDVNTAGVKYLVAHNAKFDLAVLRLEARITGIDLSSVLKLPALCTMERSKWMLNLERPDTDRRLEAFREINDMRTTHAKKTYAWLKGKLQDRSPKYPTLAELHRYLLRAENVDWHDALADAVACERCFRTLALKEITDRPIREARRKQAEVELAFRREQELREQYREQQEKAARLERQRVTDQNNKTIRIMCAVGCGVLGLVGGLGGAIIGVLLGLFISSLLETR